MVQTPELCIKVHPGLLVLVHEMTTWVAVTSLLLVIFTLLVLSGGAAAQPGVAPPPISGSDSTPPISGSDSPPPPSEVTTPSTSGSDAPPSTADAPPSTSGSDAPPSTSGSDAPSSSNGAVIAAVVVTVIAFVAVLAFVYCFIKRRRNRKNLGGGRRDNGTLPTSSPVQHDVGPDVAVPSPSSHYIGPRSFNLRELRKATENFSESRVLGRGGFGYVYRGNLPDGTVVAVKRIADDSRQGEKEFQAELKTIGNLRHRNLVKLKGWCFDERSYLLVYEHMANGSLDILLFDNALCARLTWKRRWSIALGLGSALLYLHEECDNVIIHRDVKASNVLLDDNFNAKLGDFGLSRQVDQGNTSHTTALAGTRGYMGPELFIGLGKATRESDVFAFGAVLLEIVTGKCVIDYGLLTNHDGMLLYWVWDMLGQGKLLDVVDKRLDESSVVAEEAKKLLIVALACSHPEPKTRPSIRQAMEALSGSAALPWVPLSRPVPSYGPLPSMSRTSRLAEEYGTDSQSTSNQTRSSVSASNPFSGSSSDPTSAV